MRPIVRGVAALLAAPALVLPALVATSAPATAATDSGPATAAGYWLGAQLQGGLVRNQEYDYDDIGGTIDVALGLDAAGAPASVVETISDAVAANVGGYIGTGGEEYAGSTAKAAVLARAAGDDPTDFGGVDLIERLEGRVLTTGATAGRTQDQSQYGDYASPFGQVYAVQALEAAGSGLTDSVTGFLLDQQCAAGFFRGSFAAVDAADQTCDGGNGQPSVDATALAIQSLQSQLDDTDVAAAVAAAVAWLAGEQNADGSFGSDQAIPTGNANSTGLAAYALLISGQDRAAAEAAAWLRARQAANVANCVYYDQTAVGAVFYDGTAQEAGSGTALTGGLLDQTVRATAQALPGLLAAQDGDPRAMFTAEYVRAGGRKPVGVVDAAPGEAVCAMLGEQSVLAYADATGAASPRIRIPARTATSRVEVANASGVFDTVRINALGAKRLAVSLTKRVAAGTRQTVKVTGLAPGETASIKVRWPSRKGSVSGAGAGGQANRKGVFKTTVTVPNRPGRAKVRVVGAFPDRKAKTSFTVTR
ncbi:prenyltransferase/squalene oxidase repeat-containing protein [Nocardioides hungaricus]